ncbi:MAG: OmpA family protein [Pacificimonas sp.]|nr:OmpA family protein [Pacificimonas sp.]
MRVGSIAVICVIGALVLGACAVPQPARPPVAAATIAPPPQPAPALPRSLPPIGGFAERFDIIRNEGSITALPPAQVEAYLDLQAERFKSIAGVSVEREAAALNLSMSEVAAFAVNSAVITPGFRRTLDAVSAVLATYPQSYVDVVGHTDSSGSDAVNQQVSERRAASVANYLAAKGVKRVRIAVRGAGEAEPVASNATESGRAANRRVDVRIVPITTGLVS